MSRTPALRNVRLSEWRRDSLWLGPALAAAGAWVLAVLLTAHSPAFVARDHLFSTNIDDARLLLSTIAAAILTFTGVVFSITLVALQTASSQYSPRVLRNFVRKPVTKIALATFIATFVYALVVLARLGTLHRGTEAVPAAAVGVAFLLVIISVFVFVVFVHATVRSMRVTYVVEAIAHETMRTLGATRAGPPVGPGPSAPGGSGPARTLAFEHHGAVLDGLDVDRLVALAATHDAVLVLHAEIGTYLPRGTAFMDVHGGPDLTRRSVLRLLDLAPVRTFYQDARWGVRQLVDIAIRALSPAVNDPTTAVQALDRLHDILRVAAAQPDPTGREYDGDGRLRLVRPVAGWVRLADLAFTEIVRYGADSPQISRKLMAVFDDLHAALDPTRQPVIAAHRRALLTAVHTFYTDAVVRDAALTPDRLGLG